MKRIPIDRNKRLRDEPHTGHNRWHPDIAPIVEIAPGEELVLETRDAADGQIGPATTLADIPNHDAHVAHPLTGPVLVQGAQPGDLLFFYSPISHVSVYLGGGQQVHAPNTGSHVKIGSVNWGKVSGVGRPG